jgi:hypothetical protein
LKKVELGWESLEDISPIEVIIRDLNSAGATIKDFMELILKLIKIEKKLVQIWDME